MVLMWLISNSSLMKKRITVIKTALCGIHENISYAVYMLEVYSYKIHTNMPIGISEWSVFVSCIQYADHITIDLCCRFRLSVSKLHDSSPTYHAYICISQTCSAILLSSGRYTVYCKYEVVCRFFIYNLLFSDFKREISSTINTEHTSGV